MMNNDAIDRTITHKSLRMVLSRCNGLLLSASLRRAMIGTKRWKISGTMKPNWEYNKMSAIKLITNSIASSLTDVSNDLMQISLTEEDILNKLVGTCSDDV
jgi:hypothetical protein